MGNAVDVCTEHLWEVHYDEFLTTVRTPERPSCSRADERKPYDEQRAAVVVLFYMWFVAFLAY